MKEKLYTIPINDAFAMDSECPICAMKTILENNAVEFTMGPSYMEDDIRMEVNKKERCGEDELFAHSFHRGLFQRHCGAL